MLFLDDGGPSFVQRLRERAAAGLQTQAA